MWKSLHKELAHHCTLNNQFLSRKLNVGRYSEKVTFVKYGNVYQGDELYDEKLIKVSARYLTYYYLLAFSLKFERRDWLIAY